MFWTKIKWNCRYRSLSSMKKTELNFIEHKFYYCDSQRHLKLGTGKSAESGNSIIFYVLVCECYLYLYFWRQFSQNDPFRNFGLFCTSCKWSRACRAKTEDKTTATAQTKFGEKLTQDSPPESHKIRRVHHPQGFFRFPVRTSVNLFVL